MSAFYALAGAALVALIAVGAVAIPTDLRTCSPREWSIRMALATGLALASAGLMIAAIVMVN